MILTNTHAQFWLKHCSPQWARKFRNGCTPEATIDACVNAHVPRPERRDERHHAQNLCNLVRSVRRRNEDVLAYLDKLALEPGTVIRPKRRAGYARKWAERIRANRPVPSRVVRTRSPLAALALIAAFMAGSEGIQTFYRRPY